MLSAVYSNPEGNRPQNNMTVRNNNGQLICEMLDGTHVASIPEPILDYKSVIEKYYYSGCGFVIIYRNWTTRSIWFEQSKIIKSIDSTIPWEFNNNTLSFTECTVAANDTHFITRDARLVGSAACIFVYSYADDIEFLGHVNINATDIKLFKYGFIIYTEKQYRQIMHVYDYELNLLFEGENDYIKHYIVSKKGFQSFSSETYHKIYCDEHIYKLCGCEIWVYEC